MKDKDRPWLGQSSAEDERAPEPYDWEEESRLQQRNRTVLRPQDGVYRDEYGGVCRVRNKPFVAGRQWRFLQDE